MTENTNPQEITAPDTDLPQDAAPVNTENDRESGNPASVRETPSPKKRPFKDPSETFGYRRSEIPDLNDFDEDEIFCRMTTDENIFNSRGLAKAPRMEDSGQERYRQMGCCAQMHSYQWTNLFPTMSAESDFPIVQVRFKNTHKDFFRLPENDDARNFQTGDIVTVESTNGHDTGIICLKGELVRLQLKKKGIKVETAPIKRIIRKARQNDVDKWIETIQAEKEMQRKARIIAAQLGLSMKINNVEIQGDYTKAIFYYTADDRVDFRQLIKLYAEEFKLRIEMRQIGARQESGILGGIGSCGRELCCVTFLHNFTSVSTHAARVQQVSLNPQKLAGQCSKLKCCLNYEYEVYMDAMKSMPDTKTVLRTEKGEAHCIKTDPLKRTLTYTYSEAPGVFAELKAEQVFDIMEKNKRGEIVGNLNDFAKESTVTLEPETEFQQVVGQDELTRFDKPKENRKKKDRKKPQRREQEPNESRSKQEGDRKQEKSPKAKGETAEQSKAADSKQGERRPASPKGNRNPNTNNSPNKENGNDTHGNGNRKNKGPKPVRSLQKPILKNAGSESSTSEGPQE